MKPLFFRRAGLLLAGSLLFTACQKESSPDASLTTLEEVGGVPWGQKGQVTYKGPQVRLGQGQVRSWFSFTREGVPVEIGLEISHQALLPLGDHPDQIPDHTTHVVPLPVQAQGRTAFQHIGVNWNPNGHPPPGIFDPPHFDFHFYLISVEDRLAIPTYAVNPAGFDNMPTGDYLPAGFGAPPGPTGAEPAMGKHLLRPHVFAPGYQFQKEMIYGSFNGRLIFVEPMITLAYLMSGVSNTEAFGQPVRYYEAGYYPTSYRIWMDPLTKKHYVSLSEFRWFN